jgi:hypothetical protein
MSVLRWLRARITRLFSVHPFERPDAKTRERQRKENEFEIEARRQRRDRWRL